VLRVIVDTPVVYRLAMDPDTEALMREAVTDGHLVLVAAHLRREQVERVPRERRDTLVRFVADVTVQTTTAGLALDVTRWGGSPGLSNTHASTNETVPIGNPHQSAGALTLATAQREGIPIVTDDDGALRRACLELGVVVMNADELIAAVTLL
jgi:hypothetical protein